MQLVLVAFAALTHGNPAEGAPITVTAVDEEANCFDRMGVSVDLRALDISLRNVRLINDRYYVINGDKITIRDDPRGSTDILIYDAFFVTRAASRQGLVLFHAQLGAREYIYWIEKRIDQLSRNGLLEINSDGLSLACVGTIHR